MDKPQERIAMNNERTIFDRRNVLKWLLTGTAGLALPTIDLQSSTTDTVDSVNEVVTPPEHITPFDQLSPDQKIQAEKLITQFSEILHSVQDTPDAPFTLTDDPVELVRRTNAINEQFNTLFANLLNNDQFTFTEAQQYLAAYGVCMTPVNINNQYHAYILGKVKSAEEVTAAGPWGERTQTVHTLYPDTIILKYDGIKFKGFNNGVYGFIFEENDFMKIQEATYIVGKDLGVEESHGVWVGDNFVTVHEFGELYSELMSTVNASPQYIYDDYCHRGNILQENPGYDSIFICFNRTLATFGKQFGDLDNNMDNVTRVLGDREDQINPKMFKAALEQHMAQALSDSYEAFTGQSVDPQQWFTWAKNIQIKPIDSTKRN